MVGANVGTLEGIADGTTVGFALGLAVVGIAEGAAVGLVGLAEGTAVGTADTPQA